MPTSPAPPRTGGPCCRRPGVPEESELVSFYGRGREKVKSLRRGDCVGPFRMTLSLAPDGGTAWE
jgi:hypothetical protein